MSKTNRSQLPLKGLDIRVVLIIVSLLAVGWLQLPRLGDEFQVDEDFRSFYWMNKFQDSDLFPTYFEGYVEIHLPWAIIPMNFDSLGYGLLFYLASFFVTPVFFSKLLAFFLMPLMVWYSFKFGQAVRGYSTGIILALGLIFLSLISSTSFSVLTGLQRSFSLLLMIIFIYFFYCQKYGLAALVALISVLIYPPVFALMVVMWGVFILKLRSQSPYLKFVPSERGFISLLIVMVLGLIIMTPVLLPRFTNTFIEPESAEIDNSAAAEEIFPTYQYLWDDPHYGSEGRRRLFVYFPLVGRGGLVNKELDAFNLLVMFALGLLISLVRGRKAFNLPEVIWCMLGASFIFFILAWLGILFTNSFIFYLPSRYTRVVLFLFLFMFIFLNLMDFMQESSRLIRLNPQKQRWLIVAGEIVILGIIVFYPLEWAMIKGLNVKWLLIFAGISLGILSLFVKNTSRPVPDVSRVGHSFAGRILIGVTALALLLGWLIYAPVLQKISSLDPSETERSLYSFINTLPKDVLIAGTPCTLNSVPLFAKRQILFSCERYDKEDPIVLNALEAYYTDDREVLIDFCRTHNIDYLVVDSETYSTEYLQQGHLFYEPYNQRSLVDIGDRDQFVLAEVPDEDKVFQTENYFVMLCDKYDGSN